ncbi:hypothetical protein Clacol_005955 [Clathrus columnatus]|uniref:Uncharacterized protein n=1 Tax=Clathrus columnatus TaxID=1419009 RepID=A0AAV5ADZ0_9AGAM|nr:hypothetical protein Clacol_005955 [Clathrus columnatus]
MPTTSRISYKLLLKRIKNSVRLRSKIISAIVDIPDVRFGGVNPDYLRYALQSTYHPVEALRRCITLSKDLPLEVYVRPWALGKLSHPLVPHLTLLKAECHRIRKFMAGHMNHEELIHFFPIIPGQVNEFPMMEVFYLSGYTSRVDITDGLPMGLIYSPNLRHLELGEAYLVECFMTTTFLPLYTLVLSSHRCLVPALIILHFISLCPHITALKLDIWNAYDTDVGWPQDRITLHQLQDLWFYANSTNNTMYLLRSLHMPRLLRVVFGERYPQNSVFRRQLFSHILLETSLTLQYLSINRNSFPGGSNLIEPLLIRMDRLRTLSFTEVEVVPSVLDLLIPPEGRPPEEWPLPWLENLSFKRVDLPGDSLIKVITTRSIPDSMDHLLSEDPLCPNPNLRYSYLSVDIAKILLKLDNSLFVKANTLGLLVSLVINNSIEIIK